jgi:hypothetical protein
MSSVLWLSSISPEHRGSSLWSVGQPEVVQDGPAGIVGGPFFEFHDRLGLGARAGRAVGAGDVGKQRVPRRPLGDEPTTRFARSSRVAVEQVLDN